MPLGTRHLLFLLLALPLVAQTTPEPADEMGALIADLSSDDYEIRENATQQLVRLGEDALPRLQRLLPITVDGETRNRIQSAIDQITEASVAGESLITLNVAEADPKSVFEELSRQSRARINVAPDVLATLPPITFRCDQEPFWPVLRRLCSPLGLQPDSLNASAAFGRRATLAPDRTLNLIKATNLWDRTPTTFIGPFMVCVQQITETGVVLPALDQRAHNLMVHCTVHAEPKLTVLGRSSTARVTEPDPAANPPGNVPGGVNNALVDFRPPFSSRSYYNPTGASVWPVMIPLARPTDAVDTLPRLKATATAKLLVRSENWELPDIARAAPRSWTVAGRTFTVKSVGRQGDNIELIATATRRTERGGADPEEQAVFNYIELLDPNGRPLNARARAQRGSEEPNTISFSVQFEATAEGAPVQPASTPLRLRWRLPLETKDVELPIEFVDLPLP